MQQWCGIHKTAAALPYSQKFCSVTNFKLKKCNIQKNAVAMLNLTKCASPTTCAIHRLQHDYSIEGVFDLNTAVY